MEHLEDIKKFVDEDLIRYALNLVNILNIPSGFAKEAASFCEDKPCILGYLYAIYLEFLDEYLEEIKQFKGQNSINDYEELLKYLEKEALTSKNFQKKSKLSMIIEELKKPLIIIKECTRQTPQSGKSKITIK